MRHIKLLCKRVAWRMLPDWAVKIVKKRYYLKESATPPLEKEPDLNVVRHLLTTGDYVVDIGANLGLYSQAFSEMVGLEGRVYSIEPFPSTFEILCYLLKKRGCDNVEPINAAVSSSEGVVTMELPYNSSGAETHYRASIVGSSPTDNRSEIAKIQATTVDSQFLDLSQKISFVKLDVEGHELECLEGSKRFLEQSQAAWLIEVSGNPDDMDTRAHKLFQILQGKDYQAWWFDGTRIRRRRAGDKSINYFFLKDKHVKTLQKRKPELLAMPT